MNYKQPLSKLLLPLPALSSCIFAFILRDTRGALLSTSERLNRFPASPLCAITWILDGECQIISNDNTPTPMPRLAFSGPQQNPILSFNPRPVHALTVGIYPEAWKALTGQDSAQYINKTVPLKDIIDTELLETFTAMFAPHPFAQKHKTLETNLTKKWQQTRPQGANISLTIQDWFHTLASQATTSGAGKSIRQIQRRIKSWAGQSQRDIASYARMELLFSNWLKSKNNHSTLADLALDTGFSDQSHMGREVHRLIGISPAKLNQLIDTDESFWFYRLMGEKF